MKNEEAFDFLSYDFGTKQYFGPLSPWGYSLYHNLSFKRMVGHA